MAQPPATGREKLSWCLFDFANSSFTTVIVTVIFGPTFQSLIVPGRYAGLKGETWWALALAGSQVLVLLTAPWIGARADRGAAKKRYLFRSWIACWVFTALLFFMGPGMVLPAFFLFIAANLSFSIGENLIAAFLPELASPEEMGRLSGLGWAVGYAGGLIALLLALPFAKGGSLEGLRWTNLTTAAFFALAGLPTFLWLKERAVPRPRPRTGGSPITRAFRDTWKSLGQRKAHPDLFAFLLALVLFQAGVACVVGFSSIYAKDEIGFSSQDLIRLFIGLQIAAGVGALLFGYLQDWMGSRRTLLISLFLWCVAVIVAWKTQRGDVAGFTVAGILSGLAMGSTQSASRAVVGLLCPRGSEGEWFGLWGLAVKLAGVLGPLSFGFVAEVGNLRNALLGTLLLFLGGILLLFRVNMERGRAAAIPQSATTM